MNNFNLIIEDTNIINVSTNNTPNIPGYKFVGRTTTDILYNKTITDDSNIISANNLTINGDPIPINGSGVPGDVLTLGSNSISFITPPPSIPDVVRIDVTSLVSVGGGLWFCNYGAPINAIGNSASTFTISARPGGGQQISTSKNIYSINGVVCSQYSNQPSLIRTFFNININEVAQYGCAESVPISNNWRSSLQGFVFGGLPNVQINMSLNSNAVGTITLNEGLIYILQFINKLYRNEQYFTII